MHKYPMDKDAPRPGHNGVVTAIHLNPIAKQMGIL